MAGFTKTLRDCEASGEDPLSAAFPLVEAELRATASAVARRRGVRHVRPTELVNAAYLRLVKQRERTWQNRQHFLNIASLAIYRELMDSLRSDQRARARAARFEPSQSEIAQRRGSSLLTKVDAALARLDDSDPVAADCFRYCAYMGLTPKEAGELCGISESTARRRCVTARAFLKSIVLS